MSSSIPDPVPDNATPEQLRHIINYWRIEANHANSVRWKLEEENCNLRKTLKAIQSIDPLLKEAIDSATIAIKEKESK